MSVPFYPSPFPTFILGRNLKYFLEKLYKSHDIGLITQASCSDYMCLLFIMCDQAETFSLKGITLHLIPIVSDHSGMRNEGEGQR